MDFDWLSDDNVDKLAEEIKADIASGKIDSAPKKLVECRTLEQLFAFIGELIETHWGIATRKTQEGAYIWRWEGQGFDDQTVELVSVAWPNIADKERLRMIVCQSTNISSIGLERLVERVAPAEVQWIN